MVLRRFVAYIVAAFLLAISGVFAGSAEAKAWQPAGVTRPVGAVTGASVAAALAAGRSFDGFKMTIDGSIDLKGPVRVAGSFRCSSCVITGSLNASDVEFQDVVDLENTTVNGSVDLQGALFDRAVVWSRATISQTASFKLAVFRQRGNFDGTVFGGLASFSGARFESESSFAGVDFRSTAAFDGVVFVGDSTFASNTGKPAAGSPAARCTDGSSVAFGGDANFTRASFNGRADFRNRCFTATANLSGVVIQGPSDFGSAEFLGGAEFSESSFGADASFKLADFHDMAYFEDVSAAHDLTFEGARFDTGAALNGASIGGTLSFDLAPVLRQLSLDDITVGGIKLNPASIGVVAGQGTRLVILEKVEDTARADGDSATANDARFIRLQLAGDARLNQAARWSLQWDWVLVQDRIFYQLIAGYLVRPWHPLVAFGLLAILAIAVQVAWPWWQRRAKARKAARSKELAKDGADPALPADADDGDQPAEAPGVVAVGARVGTADGAVRNPDAPGPGTSASAPRPDVAGSKEQPETRRRLGAKIVPLLEAVRRTVKVALVPQPTEETKNSTKELNLASDYFLALARWIEYAGYKILFVLYIMCVANANATLHQFIDTIIGGR